MRQYYCPSNSCQLITNDGDILGSERQNKKPLFLERLKANILLFSNLIIAPLFQFFCFRGVINLPQLSQPTTIIDNANIIPRRTLLGNR
jgi:hypothetical protein